MKFAEYNQLENNASQFTGSVFTDIRSNACNYYTVAFVKTMYIHRSAETSHWH